jgi:hypothetical protein
MTLSAPKERYSLQEYYEYAKRQIECDDIVLDDRVEKVVGGAWISASIWVSDDDLAMEQFRYDD